MLGFITEIKKVYLTQRRKDATSQSKFCKKIFAPLRLCAFALILSLPILAQTKITVLTPEKSDLTQAFAEKLEAGFSGRFKVLNSSLSESAFFSGGFKKPFNLTTDEAKNAAEAIGCNYFLLVKTNLQRRSAFKRDEYYEAYSVVYVVSAKTGNLVYWTLKSFDDDQSSEAQKSLFGSVKKFADEISEKIKADEKTVIKSVEKISFEEVPDENSPLAKDFRPPLPYKRISPKYTDIADIYNIEATIEATVDVDADGKILNVEITRWAGYGLDESVVEAIKTMNWRAADRKGKPIAMRILLRYNFKDIEDEEDGSR